MRLCTNINLQYYIIPTFFTYFLACHPYIDLLHLFFKSLLVGNKIHCYLATRPEVGKKKSLTLKGRSQIGVKFINQEKQGTPSTSLHARVWGVSSIVYQF